MRRFLAALLVGPLLAAFFTGPLWAADGIQLNSGSGGDILCADDDGTYKHQCMVIEFGPDGSPTPVTFTDPLPVQGGTAHGSAVGDIPLQGGLEARTTLGTAVTDGQAVRATGDPFGRQYVVLQSPRELVVTKHVTLTTMTETTIVAAVASTFMDLVFLQLSNESTSEVRVDIADTTTGADVMSIDLAPNGGLFVTAFPVPMPQTSVNTNWTATLSGAVSSVYITTIAVKNK